MKDKEKLRERFMRDPLVVSNLLDEAKHLIEWTAAELVQMQTMISLWQRTWQESSQNPKQRALLSVQAKDWSDKAVDFSGPVCLIESGRLGQSSKHKITMELGNALLGHSRGKHPLGRGKGFEEILEVCTPNNRMYGEE